jgi:hypothetical protein
VSEAEMGFMQPTPTMPPIAIYPSLSFQNDVSQIRRYSGARAYVNALTTPSKKKGLGAGACPSDDVFHLQAI